MGDLATREMLAAAVPVSDEAAFEEKSVNPRWSAAKRLGFRFVFAYLVLFCLPSQGRVSLISEFDFGFVDTAIGFFIKPFHVLNEWLSVHLFHLQGAVTHYHPTGSGDTTLDYIEVFAFFWMALIVAIVWTLLDRRRANYVTLHAWLRVLVRYTLAFTLLSYGLYKLLPLQFSAPSFGTLNERYGDSSPMHLLWTFMGASAGYRIFGGVAEVLPGVLLFFRRTTPLGALLGSAVMINVVALNFFYDVPVKIYSTQIVLLCAFLLLPEIEVLGNVLVLRRASLPVVEPRVWFERRWMRWTAVALKTIFAALWLYNVYSLSKQVKERNASAYTGELRGIWLVDSFAVAGQEASVTSPSGRWSRLVLGRQGSWLAEYAYGGDRSFASTYQGNTASLRDVGAGPKTTPQAVLAWQKIDGTHLVLNGTLDGKPVAVKLHGSFQDTSLLMNRGFHWINEDPYQR